MASPIYIFVGDMDFYVRNNEWTVMSFPARRNVAYYKCCPEPFPDVTFYLKIRRKPLFYILSVLFPCMLTSSVAILAFLLPPESGEKVSLNVTILLSLAVFLLMVSDQLPASSDHFPYVGEPWNLIHRGSKKIQLNRCMYCNRNTCAWWINIGLHINFKFSSISQNLFYKHHRIL